MPSLTLSLPVGFNTSPAFVVGRTEPVRVAVRALDLGGADEIVVAVQGTNPESHCWVDVQSCGSVLEGELLACEVADPFPILRLCLHVLAPPGWDGLAWCRVDLPGELLVVGLDEEPEPTAAPDPEGQAFARRFLAEQGVDIGPPPRRGPPLSLASLGDL